MADIGTMWIQIKGLTLDANCTSSLTPDRALVVDISWLTLNFDSPGPFINIEGLNDFGIVVNNTGNTIASIVRNRLASIVNEQLLTPKINNLVNQILLLVP